MAGEKMLGVRLQKIVGISAYVSKVPRYLDYVGNDYVCDNLVIETLIVPIFHIGRIRDVEFLPGEWYRSKRK